MSRLCCCFRGAGFPEKASKVSSSNGEPPNGLKPPASKPVEDSSTAIARSGKSPSQSAVLVELFTSQGCSSCPSADLVISKLGQAQASSDVPIIVLAYHVEYWDYLGWKDPFANNRWSGRQRAYGEALQQDSIYTPEVVVQGRSHCIGSNADSITSLISAAPRFPFPDVRGTVSRPSSSTLEVSVSVSLKSKVEGNVDVLVALFENSQVTDCTKGENRGRVLTNDFIVRGLEKACTFQNAPPKKSVKGQVNFTLWDSYSKSRSGMAVFFQKTSSMEVFGAQLLELPDDN